VSGVVHVFREGHDCQKQRCTASTHIGRLLQPWLRAAKAVGLGIHRPSVLLAIPSQTIPDKMGSIVNVAAVVAAGGVSLDNP